LLEGVWRRAAGFSAAEAKEIVDRLGGGERARQMCESYKEEAVKVLSEIDNPSLKGLLRRVVSKIFGVEVKGWCSEFETRNAASGAAVAEVAG
jgi:geranylgeranyl diphosphate synthase, type II